MSSVIAHNFGQLSRDAVLLVLSGGIATSALVAFGRAIAGARLNRSLRAGAARMPLYVQPSVVANSAPAVDEPAAVPARR